MKKQKLSVEEKLWKHVLKIWPEATVMYQELTPFDADLREREFSVLWGNRFQVRGRTRYGDQA